LQKGGKKAAKKDQDAPHAEDGEGRKKKKKKKEKKKMQITMDE
jgi:hypothetical protein